MAFAYRIIEPETVPSSGVPYPTAEQVDGSVAFQRLFWLRSLPAPRTRSERAIIAAIRIRGVVAPDDAWPL